VFLGPQCWGPEFAGCPVSVFEASGLLLAKPAQNSMNTQRPQDVHV
jgi:hypothetical protein